MAKNNNKKEGETKKVVANCENQQLVVATCDLKNINIESLIRTIRGQKESKTVHYIHSINWPNKIIYLHCLH